MKHKAGYIGIKESSQLVGVHPDTIRRLVKQHIGTSNIYKGKGTKAPYLINQDWLLTIYNLNEPHTAPTTGDNQKDDETPDSNSDKAISAVIEALTKQLEAKDKQIESLQVIIKEKEDNTTKLQDQFQQLLASAQLPARTQSRQAYEAEATQPETQEKPKTNRKPKTTKQVNKNSHSKGKKAKPATQKPEPKKRWWSR